MAADADALHDALRAVAHDVLFRFGREAPAQRAAGHAHNKVAEVRVMIQAFNGGGGGDGRRRRVGSWMSPTETLIVSKLDAETMTRMALADRCGMSYDPKFKTIVSNLIERGIIEDADDGKGIRAVRA